MKTKTIFSLLAFAMLTAAMVLTTACSGSEDLADNKPETTEPTEPVAKKGYELPVTVNVTRQGDVATRATFDGSKLNFSDGDKLFVYGNDNSVGGAGQFAGTLDYVSEGTFSGTIYTKNSYSGTADELFTAASAGTDPDLYVTATLLPNNYESTGFLSIDNKNTTDIAYDDRLTRSYSNAFVASETAKATGVEQLSLEQASTYSSGFALSPGNAILNFTITGLEAGAKDVSLHIHHGLDYDVTGSVTPNASGVATFAVGVPVGANIKDTENNLTVGIHNFTLPSSTTFAVGKIYNIERAAKVVDLSNLSGDYIAQNGEVLTGTLAGNYSIDIANDATVTLYNVNINGDGKLSGTYPGIDCRGNATIILTGENVVKGLGADYPGIFNGNAPTTLTIQGDGSLTATGHGEGAGIGGSKLADCGSIVINSGTITANGGPSGGAGIGAGTWASCKDITINGGTITATGGPGAAGIGSAKSRNGDSGPSDCGAITIANTVTKVTATKGTDAPCSIGKGADDTEMASTCGTVTIGGTEYWKNNAYVGTGSTYLTQSPLVYQP